MSRIIITGGGTGGHVYPALALAGAFRERNPGAVILYVGTEKGLEARVVPGAGFEFRAIQVRGLVGKSPRQILAGFRSLRRGMGQARKIIRDFEPDLVVGTGGYVSGPVVWAASRARVPTMIQEQNLYPGITNRILSMVVNRVALPHPEAGRHFPRRARVVTTGNPVRPEVLSADRNQSRDQLSIPGTGLLVLIMGGSQGAASINAAVLDMLTRRGFPSWHLLWVTGHNHHVTISRELAERGLDPERAPCALNVIPYLREMPQGLAAADLVVTRAGAMTLAEITARGLPSILVPFPHAAHQHQERNAELVAGAGAGFRIADDELDGQVLGVAIDRLLSDPDRLERMGRASGKLGRPLAVESLVEEMDSLLKSRR